MIKNLIVGCIILWLSISCAGNQDGSSSGQNDSRPNIIFIMSDDHTSQAISAYGGMLADIAPTPNIDRLADEGMLFNNAFVTNSICTPSRAVLLTGKYSHKNGVYKFTALDHSQPTLPKMMQRAGYETAHIGKYHLHSNPVGFDYFSVLPGQGDYFDPEFIQKGDEHPSGWVKHGQRTQFEGHSSDVITDQTLDYLKNKQSGDKPFMLFANFKAPHDPWDYAERYDGYLADVEIPEPSNLLDNYDGRSDALKQTTQHLDDIALNWSDPAQLKRETEGLEGDAKTRKIYQMYMKKYLRSVKGVDDNMGRLLDYLDESGLAQNTIIMYTGDQGFFLGEHGLYDKRFMYEEALGMPLLVRWPQEVEKKSVSDGMVLNVDYAPTILDVAGLEPHPEMQGRSFLPLLRGNQPSDWRNSMYYRYYFSHFDTEPHYGVRTYDHKLIYYNRIDQWELYDIKEDPKEMKNLYGDPDYNQVTGQLKTELTRLQKELGDLPEDNGSKPNLGKLAPDPIHSSDNLPVGTGDKTILLKFKSTGGGTIFSQTDLSGNPFEENAWTGDKTLYIRNSSLMFTDSGQEMMVEKNIEIDQWYNLAFVIQDKQPLVYINGNLEIKTDSQLSPNKAGQTFNIGAGLSGNGYNGYNFVGEIDHVVAYGRVLEKEEIVSHTRGAMPNEPAVFKWEN
ncbi:sulfatase-like hydrolase/transferase [Halalkalibaculum sp. DA3122]|uniref:sulfatase-like hydrolase/transferase n=1 Tax=Halalkalibaculum sp. DA3122 TaxID=3373607 RepID=UPI003754D779